ncbi:MAG: SMC family ATPase [Gemmataceae bacterium]|nr:SMC family ATPase [Gemmata sp.]MDW8196248.1 SMC family ATPase [Gemmataceae bacterium]
MIPQRIKIAGFLSYKDEQEICFDGSPLWMLSGSNGSGKSSVFDAVTFALFGHHRGGSQNLSELINKDSRELSVEFDFTCDQQRYRIQRTIKRQRNDKVQSTQQILRYDSTHSGGDPWQAIPDTHSKKEFDRWVRDHVGLDYETFTSSVLLLQGKAEKLLDSTPAGRASVLSRIVDLERYQKLHAKADERRKELKGQLEVIANQLAAIPEVSEEEFEKVQARIAQAQTAYQQAVQTEQQLRALEQRARHWTDIHRRLASKRQQLAETEKLLGAAAAVEKDYQRFSELKSVLPLVGTIVSQRSSIRKSECETEKLKAQQTEVEDQLRRIRNRLEQERKNLDDQKKTLADNQEKKSQLEKRLRELGIIVTLLNQLADAQAKEQQFVDELNQLPSQPEERVQELQREFDRLQRLQQDVTLLERLHDDRVRLIQKQHEYQRDQERAQQLRKEGLCAKSTVEELERQYQAAQKARAEKDKAVAEAGALARQAWAGVEELRKMRGHATCRTCGQKLTPEHLAAEKKHREAAAAAAEEKLQQLRQEAETAQRREKELADQLQRAQNRLNQLRDEWKEADAAIKQAQAMIDNHTDACRRTYLALPQEYKDRLGPTEPADWTQTRYPDRYDISTLAQQAHDLSIVEQKLKNARAELTKVQLLQANLALVRTQLDKLRQSLAGDDPILLRQEHLTKQQEEKTLTQTIRANKIAIDTLEKTIEQHQRKQSDAERTLTEIAGKLAAEQQSREQSTKTIEQAKRSLPAAWQKALETVGMADDALWKQEYEALIAKDVEGQYKRLEIARGALLALRAEIDQLARDEAAFRPEERRCLEDVQAELVAARQQVERLQREQLEAENDKRRLDERHQSRSQLEQKYRQLDTQHNRYKLLAELLGRDRLQRHLVRQAERQIVDYANGILDRLSGGQLFLKLVESETGTDKALDLECANRVTGGTPINVAFLSGSQRFRVAVALALGIGQYASKQHRPIESVIIDEGFGCLDRAGRQVMIQELQNLRGHLHCILLVSHQEEFADAFPDGYRFELHNGATRVSRFER